jgi:diketogulonate reductase-like aldo/keto reductase
MKLKLGKQSKNLTSQGAISGSLPRQERRPEGVNSYVYIHRQLWNSFHDPKDIERVLDESLARLGTDYLDLYLIHW